MAPNARARRNHEQLFPGHVSTLARTDPELIEVFDNFAFGEALEVTRLDVVTRLMAQLAAMIAVHAVGEFRVMLRAALTVGVTPSAAKEVAYQAVPYVGMARVFDFLHVMNDVLTERGVALPLPPQSRSAPETRAAVGLEVQRNVIGQAALDQLHASMPADQQHLLRFLTGNCFGDHVSRGEIDLQTRELLTFSMLVALGGCESQVKAHVLANVRVGNDRARLIDVLTQLLPYIGYPRTLNGLRVVNEATQGADERSSSADTTPTGEQDADTQTR